MEEQSLIAVLALACTLMTVGMIRSAISADLSEGGLLSWVNVKLFWPGSGMVISLFGWSTAFEVGDEKVSLLTYAIGTAYVTAIWLAVSGRLSRAD